MVPGMSLPRKRERSPDMLTPAGRARLFYRTAGRHVDKSVQLLVPKRLHPDVRPVSRIYGFARFHDPEGVLSRRGLSRAKLDALHSRLISDRLGDAGFERMVKPYSLRVWEDGDAAPKSTGELTVYRELKARIKPLLREFKVGVPAGDVLGLIITLEGGRRSERELGIAHVDVSDSGAITVTQRRVLLPALELFTLSHEVGHIVLNQTKKAFPEDKWELHELFAHAFGLNTMIEEGLGSRQAMLPQFKGDRVLSRREVVEPNIAPNLKKWVRYLAANSKANVADVKRRMAAAPVEEKEALESEFKSTATHMKALNRLERIFKRNGWDLRKSMLEVRDTVYGA
jgi:hypothetical protein